MTRKKILFYSWWTLKIALASSIACILLRGIWEAADPPQRELQYYRIIQEHLTHTRFEGYSTIQVIRKDPFQIVALSDMAIGLMNLSKKGVIPKQESLPLIDEIQKRALSSYVSPYPSLTTETDFTTGGIQGLYLSHLNLIFGIHQYLHGEDTPNPLYTKITILLSAESNEKNSYHVPSFANGDQWPADETVTLLSLYVYDQVNHTQYSNAPIQGWLTFMHNTMIDPETGLNKSALADRWYKDIPRGGALSWTLLYMSQFAPEEAQHVYDLYREKMWKEFAGIGGFREWPSGVRGHINQDTGPIIATIGSAATALSIGPTRLMHDDHHYTLIMRLFSLLGIPHFSPLIGKAILFSGETATYWFTDFKPHSYENITHFPWLICILYLDAVTLILMIVLFSDIIIKNIWKNKKVKNFRD